MNPALIIGGLAAGVALLALTAKPRTGTAVGGPNLSESVRGFPINEAEYHRLRNALKSPEANSEYLMAYFKAPTIQVAIGEGPTEIKRLEAVAREQFRARRTTLPKDATGAIDKYSKERYRYFANTQWVDEFGREPSGLPSNFGKTFLTVAQQVAPMIPGVGTAAGAALSYAIAVGQGKSQKDALLAGARGALPPQYQLAFDLGVGVANGQGVDEAAKQAFFNKMPGSQQVYEQGKELYGKVS